MRQAGIIAAGALYAVENHRTRLADDHFAATCLASVIEGSDKLHIRGSRVDTNIVVIDIDPEFGSAASLVNSLADNNIACFAIGPQAIRLVTHLDITIEDIGAVATVFAKLIHGAAATQMEFRRA